MAASKPSQKQAVMPGEPLATLEQFGGMLISRRTVNFFRPEPVPRELLLDAVEVARWAPNHKLTEPWHFYLLGEETIEQVRQLIVEIKAAGENEKNRAGIRARLEAIPNWFAVTCSVSPDNPVRQQEDYAACACAVQNLSLYLWQAGIGIKWTSGKVIRDDRFYRLLDINRDEEIVTGLFWCGYPAHDPTPQKRRSPNEICTELP